MTGLVIAGSLLLATYFLETLTISFSSFRPNSTYLLILLIMAALLGLGLKNALKEIDRKSDASSSRLSIAAICFAVLIQAFQFLAIFLTYSDRVMELSVLRNFGGGSLSISESGRAVFSGYIGSDSLEAFKALDIDDILVLELNSKGGLVDPAIEISKLLSGVNLEVREECSSACLIVALGGKSLSATASSRFGFHKGSDIAGRSTSVGLYNAKKATEDLKRALTNADVPESVLELMLSTESDDIAYLSGEKLFALDVVQNLIK